MPASHSEKLPFIKKKSLTRKSTLSISKIQISKSKSKLHPDPSEPSNRKLSLNPKNCFNLQKRSLSQKRFSLKSIKTDKSLKNLKFSDLNTDDNSESEKNFETFQQSDKNPLKPQSITQRAVDLLKNMRQVDKIAKLYKRETVRSKNSDQTQQSKKILKIKYKCLVNAHVFGRKSKHNNSEGAKSRKINQRSQLLGEQFWQNINQSLILQSCRHQEPSKELFELVENIRTEA